jgi:beta-mannosidase
MAEIISITGRHVARLCDGWRLALTPAGSAATPDDLAPTLDWIAASVPGTAAQALRAAGRFDIHHPARLHGEDIWYRTRFDGRGHRILRFAGLATIAEVWLNGARILASDNMFLAHEVAVELAPSSSGSDNELAIVFRSLDKALAAKKGRARWRTQIVESNALRHVRTTLLGHMTGWQPAVHAVGPWRAIELIDETGPVTVRSAEMRAALEGDDGLLTVALEVEWRGVRPMPSLEASGRNCPLIWTGDRRIEGTLRLPKVEKWWPHTHGTPALHQVIVRIGNVEIDLGRTGFRSIEVDRGADGKGFGLTVNGHQVFARGACWSASDLVTLAGDRAALAPWLQQIAAAHMNMVRVGGTMAYESADFFALCDELGLLVWHDFMFASMDYPVADAGFRASIDAEVAQFLGRTQSHPSLAVLCGGSEVSQQVAMLGVPLPLWTGPLYEEILPRAVEALRPDAIYVAHSPGSPGDGGDLPFATNAGVSHYYGVGAYLRPLEDARRADVRFTSECLAFANVPNVAAKDVPWDDPVRWIAAVPRDRGASWDFEDVRDHYVKLLYGVEPSRLRAEDPARYLRLSRAATAEVMETTVAEWRRTGSSCQGALVWMLKDFLPGAGWGVIDAGGLPKLAWHGLRRAFRPVQVALTDEGLNGLGIHLINETPRSVTTRLALRCFQDGETVVMRRERGVELAAGERLTISSAELIGSFFDLTYAYRFGPAPLNATLVTLDDAETGVRLADAVHFPLGRAALVTDPGLNAELVPDEQGWTLRLRATKLAPTVQIEDAHFRAEDEGFHLAPGEERMVRLLAVDASGAAPAGEVFAGSGATATGYEGKGHEADRVRRVLRLVAPGGGFTRGGAL